MASIDRAGVEIYYEHHRWDDPRAPTILLSHGYSATSAMWAGQIDALTRTHHLILWDMRGHGKSDSPEDPARYSEALTVGDMAAILDACEVQQAVIGGLSLGGYMTLAFHATHPERCLALLLFDTGPGYKSDPGRDTWNRTANARARALETQGLGALGEGQEVRISQHRSAQGLVYCVANSGTYSVSPGGQLLGALPPLYSMYSKGTQQRRCRLGSRPLGAPHSRHRRVAVLGNRSTIAGERRLALTAVRGSISARISDAVH